MDIDPLGDTAPPRYAVESDEEDEFNPLTSRADADQDRTDIRVVGNLASGKGLIIVAGELASYWASGAKLGEQIGAVFVNEIQVGMLFTPAWTSAVILVSEATTKLPLRMMHPYASFVLDSLKPSIVALLDVYPHHAYIAIDPVPYHQAPIRSLSTTKVVKQSSDDVTSFETPNLVTSTSAAFMAILSNPSKLVEAILFLLPVPKIPAPPPRDLELSDVHRILETTAWPAEVMQRSSDLLIKAVGGTTGIHWESTKPELVTRPKKTVAIGEGSMYI